MSRFTKWAMEALETLLLFTFAMGLIAGFSIGRLYFGGWL